MAPPRRNRASPWAIVLAATLLAAGLATVAAGRALRVDPVKTSDPDALQPVSLDPQGQKHPYAWEELTWVANGAAAAQQAQRSPAAAAPAPAAAVSDGSDFGVVRCDMVVSGLAPGGVCGAGRTQCAEEATVEAVMCPKQWRRCMNCATACPSPLTAAFAAGQQWLALPHTPALSSLPAVDHCRGTCHTLLTPASSLPPSPPPFPHAGPRDHPVPPL